MDRSAADGFVFALANHSEQRQDQHDARQPAESKESKELESFVGRYLELADTAIGFSHRLAANNKLIVSTCMHCQHVAAALDPRLLAFVENLHVCLGKKDYPR